MQHADVSFNLTPSKQTSGGMGSAGTPGYTPSKLLLTHAERRMNMLTPSQGSKVANADLETGKVSLCGMTLVGSRKALASAGLSVLLVAQHLFLKLGAVSSDSCRGEVLGGCTRTKTCLLVWRPAWAACGLCRNPHRT